MQLDRRFFLVVAMSLIWALLVSGVFYRLASGERVSGASGPEKPLVVASRPLPLGTVIDKDSVKSAGVPEKLFPKGGFSRAEDVLGRGVISNIEPDEPIVETRLAAKGSGVGLASMIPPGMRAISVRVNDVVGVAGFVLPGMRVDVLVTGRPPRRDDVVTTTVLQNITVISAGQTIQVDAKSQPINAQVVTLLVDPVQAEALTLANIEGKIQLILRNSTDQVVAQTRGRQTSELYGVERTQAAEATPKPASAVRKPSAEPARPPAPQSIPAPALDEVVVIRGNVKTLEPASAKPVSAK